jgi:UDP-N-acetylmuramate--alanine ligase
MSGLARLLVESGAVVSGSDLADSAVLEGLREIGVTVAVGHEAKNVAHVDVVMWSPAVAGDNAELVAARAAEVVGVPEINPVPVFTDRPAGKPAAA